MKKFLLYVACGMVLLTMTASSRFTTIFVIGDSTAAEKDDYLHSPERGWGMVLQGCLDDKVVVENHAVNGRSTKSFIDEGRWQKVVERIKPGDYVFIQFGHNDEKPFDSLHTVPGGTFDANLRKFVHETRAKGGFPVLFNSVIRRCWYKDGAVVDDEKLRGLAYDGAEKINSDTLVDTHGAYVIAPRNVARELHVPFIDATQITHDLETKMGVVGSRKLHMWFKPGENKQIPKGRQDNTHYNVEGSRIIAQTLMDAVGKQIPELGKHVIHNKYVVSSKGRGNYMSLQEAVDDVKVGENAVIVVLDGKWKKPYVPTNKKVKIVMYFDAEIIKNY